jgi:hypothetical protein
MADVSLNRRMTVRLGSAVAFAQIGIIGFDGPIDLQALRLYGLPEATPAVLNGTPLLSGPLSGSGRREFAAEVSWDLSSLAAGATALLDVTVTGARVGDLAQASLARYRPRAGAQRIEHYHRPRCGDAVGTGDEAGVP